MDILFEIVICIVVVIFAVIKLGGALIDIMILNAVQRDANIALEASLRQTLKELQERNAKAERNAGEPARSKGSYK
jgi:hypothetical protein